MKAKTRRPAVRLLASAGALALVATACGSADGGVVTYNDPDLFTQVKVPSDWHVYQAEELTTVPFVATAPGIEFPLLSSIAFDASPLREPANMVEPISTSAFPVGSSVVRQISSAERDLVSRRLLADLVVPYRTQPANQELEKADFQFDNDFEGIRTVVVYTDAATQADAGVIFVSVTDPEVTKMYSFAVGCSLDCFRANQTAIESVVNSWLVNTRG